MSSKSTRNGNRQGLSVQRRVKPVCDALSRGELSSGRRLLGEMALDLIAKTRCGEVSPKSADDHFLHLLITLDGMERYGDDVYDLIVEGNALHDLGQPFGADLELMETISRRLIKERAKAARRAA